MNPAKIKRVIYDALETTTVVFLTKRQEQIHAHSSQLKFMKNGIGTGSKMKLKKYVKNMISGLMMILKEILTYAFITVNYGF